MARTAPIDRLPALLRCATEVFIRKGYRQAQMDDVAAALGVGKGTLYRVVDGKEALFHAAIRFADVGNPMAERPSLPLTTPPAGSTVARITELIAESAAQLELLRAVQRPVADDPAGELEAVVLDLYRMMSRHRTAIKLVDRCAAEYPGFDDAWFGGGRFAQVGLLAKYLEMRTASGQLKTVRAPLVFSRAMLETIAFWAVHRHWDPAPQDVDEADVEGTLRDMLVGALVPQVAA